MNDMIETTMQTPIEIALGIDENGMTTARNLYEFLELGQGQFSRWAKTNIENNEFFEENRDWWGFDVVSNGNKCKDYRLTTDFAKHLSMESHSAKGKVARQYFVAVEDKAKQFVIDRKSLPENMQVIYAMMDNQSQIYLEQKRQAEALQRLEDKTNKQTEALQTVKDTFSKSETEEETVQWVNHCINKIAESPNFVYSFGNRYAAAKNESYNRLSTKAGCRLDQKLRNSIARAEERGYTRAQINTINKLSVIMADKRLKQIYIGVIKEMMIAYCVEIA